MPSVDHAVELQDLRLEHPQLSAERGEARAGDLCFENAQKVDGFQQRCWKAQTQIWR
jgi:hypothetical protein